VFAPIKLNSGRNVGVRTKAFLMHQAFGQGQVIAFAEDLNVRTST
jgi:hypothetical protein